MSACLSSYCLAFIDVFEASTPYAVVPISNTIQGVVQETLLNLVHPDTHASENGSAAIRWEIIGSHTLSVQHNLVVRRGVELKVVVWVGSHEQVSLCQTPSKANPMLTESLFESLRRRWANAQSIWTNTARKLGGFHFHLPPKPLSS
jgi:prephenate dehydratase